MPFRLVPTNHFDSATVSVSPAAVSTMPLSNLQVRRRDLPWRSPNLEPQVITGNWGGDVRVVSHFSAWPTALRSALIGSRWRLELFSDVARTTTVKDTGTLDFFTPTGLGWGDFPWGAAPWGTAAGDRTARLAPLSLWFPAVNASAFRITVTNAYVDTPYFEARRIWLGEYVQAPRNASYGLAPAWRSTTQLSRNIGAPLRARRGETFRAIPFETKFFSEADRATWSDLTRDCDPANEILISLYPDDPSEHKRRDYTVMGSLEVLPPMPQDNKNFHRMQMAILES